MIKDFEQWIKMIVDADELCANYYDKVNKALSNKQLVDIALDSNGASYLCEMQSKGLALPYDIITSRFGNFINGKYTSEHKNDKGNGYTSAIYCKYDGNINAETTILTLLGCDCSVLVNNNNVIEVYADKNTDLYICCPNTSLAIVHYWGKEPEYSGNVELIKEE